MQLATVPPSRGRGYHRAGPPAGRGFRRAVCLATLAAAVLLGGGPGSADGREDETPPAGTLSFDIPAQPLDEALFAYTDATGIGVLVEDGLAAGRRSAAVKGRFTPESALSRLLNGTGLASLAPGVVYTAGEAPQAPTAGDTATVAFAPSYYDVNNVPSVTTYGGNAIQTAATDSFGGGAITVKVGGDVTGIESVPTIPISGQILPGNDTANQMWSRWLLSDGANGWYVNFGSLDQGVLSLGGNVSVTAGGDIRNLSVSTPTTGHVVTAGDGTKSLALTGGGNLLVDAGGSIYSGTYFVGDGSGVIRAGGDIASDLSSRAGPARYDIGGSVVGPAARSRPCSAINTARST